MQVCLGVNLLLLVQGLFQALEVILLGFLREGFVCLWGRSVTSELDIKQFVPFV